VRAQWALVIAALVYDGAPRSQRHRQHSQQLHAARIVGVCKRARARGREAAQRCREAAGAALRPARAVLHVACRAGFHGGQQSVVHWRRPRAAAPLRDCTGVPPCCLLLCRFEIAQVPLACAATAHCPPGPVPAMLLASAPAVYGVDPMHAAAELRSRPGIAAVAP
jgi:hypothetical protein